MAARNHDIFNEVFCVINKVHPPYLAIEGVIGAGKTTLGRLLQVRFQAGLLLEAFDENPFLSDFYSDRTRYAFQTQIFFLLSRYRQQQTIPNRLAQGALISDYFFSKDQLFARLNMAGDELAMYERLYEALAEGITHPDLVVYLRAETRTLMGRIAMRDRPYERKMDERYIDALRRAYEELLAGYTQTPILVIDSDDLDFVRKPEDLDSIEQRIRAALAGIRQPALLTLGPEVQPQISWRLPAVPPTEPRAEINWQVLGDFLALTQKVGELGGVLTQQPPTGPQGTSDALREALRCAAKALETLAQRAGMTSLD